MFFLKLQFALLPLIVFTQFSIVNILFPNILLAAEDSKSLLKDYIKNIPSNNFYILGPGDNLKMTVSDIPTSIDDLFTINGEGIITLKRLKRLYVSGLTINELTEILNKEYSKYLKDPNVELTILKYRPVKIFIDGEVSNPGYFTIYNQHDDFIPTSNSSTNSINSSIDLLTNNNNNFFPSVFDSIRKAGGININADLQNIKIIRNNSISNGGGKIQTSINLLNALDTTDLSQNIRILDGDIISIPRSDSPILSQLSKAMKTNLNPKFIDVFVNGRVYNPGKIVLNKASVLTDAIELAGGPRAIKGKILFLRYNNDGTIDRRKISFSKNNVRGSYQNPYLRTGDYIYIKNSTLTTTGEIITEVTNPLRGILSSYALLKIFDN